MSKFFTVVYKDIKPGDEAAGLVDHPKFSAGMWGHAMEERDAAQTAAYAEGRADEREAMRPVIEALEFILPDLRGLARVSSVCAEFVEKADAAIAAVKEKP